MVGQREICGSENISKSSVHIQAWNEHKMASLRFLDIFSYHLVSVPSVCTRAPLQRMLVVRLVLLSSLALAAQPGQPVRIKPRGGAGTVRVRMRGGVAGRQREQEPKTPRAEPAMPGPLWPQARGPLSAKGASRILPAPGGAESNPSHTDSEGLAKATLAALQKKEKYNDVLRQSSGVYILPKN